MPSDFGAAAQQSYGIIGIEPTGNSVKRDAWFGNAAAALEYSHPLSRGWSVFGGGEVRARGYADETLFNSLAGDVRAGAALNDGPTQWRMLAAYQHFNQEGDAPGEPKPTNDRRIKSVQGEWKHMLDTKTQVGLGHPVRPGALPHQRGRGLRPGLRHGVVAAARSRPRACRCSTSPPSAATTRRRTRWPTA